MKASLSGTHFYPATRQNRNWRSQSCALEKNWLAEAASRSFQVMGWK
jgi:hypothetical protein